MKPILSVLFALSLALGGCGKSDSEPSSGDDSSGESGDQADEGTGESAKPTEGSSGAGGVDLSSLGLQAEAPEGAKVTDAPVGDGLMVRGPNLVVTIEVASDTRPETLEAAEEEADMYSPENVETETLSDGWAFSFENEGSMGKNYFVQVRRDIGDETYWCETTASKPEQKANALAFCKSLKAE